MRIWSVAVAASLAAAVAAGPPADALPVDLPAATSAQTRPNIVVVQLDDMRADDLRSMPQVRSWMLSAGTNFTSAYVATPNCCPSRATFMSGRYVHNNGQYDQSRHAFWPGQSTVQGWLHGAGYRTAAAGKFLNWWQVADAVPPGWDSWDVFHKGYVNVPVNHNGTVSRSQEYSTDVVFNAARDAVSRWAGGGAPFYLYLNPYAPHSPWTPTSEYADSAVAPRPRVPSHGEDTSDKPPWIRSSHKTYEEATPEYVGRVRTLRTVDDRFGELMAQLRKTKELMDTLVIFTSDNGILLGEHNRYEKDLPYREAVAVPLLLRWPDHIPAGAVDDRLVGNMDLAPTILDAAGIAVQGKRFDGMSILGSQRRSVALTEYFYDHFIRGVPSWAALTTKRWKYVEYFELDHTSFDRVTFREYYDLERDPYETDNLLKDGKPGNDPDVSALHDMLTRYRTCAQLECRTAGE